MGAGAPGCRTMVTSPMVAVPAVEAGGHQASLRGCIFLPMEVMGFGCSQRKARFVAANLLLLSSEAGPEQGLCSLCFPGGKSQGVFGCPSPPEAEDCCCLGWSKGSP